MNASTAAWKWLQISSFLFCIGTSISSSTRTLYQSCLDCITFPQSTEYSIIDAKQIFIDDEQNKIIVATRGTVLRLTATSLRLSSPSEDIVDLKPKDSAIQRCMQMGKSQAVCHNFFKLLLLDTNQRLFACGTNAANPTCWRFNRTASLSPLPPTGIEGETRSPELPDQDVTGVFVSQPDNGEYLFTGISIRSGTRSTIYRTTAQDSINNYLATEGTEAFLKDAHFVSSYHIPDEFIYFFFRETAIEEKPKAVYSRVGRVCSYDSGGLFVLSKKFTSFTKSRIECASPGDVQFNFDLIQSTFKYGDGPEAIIFGVFTTPKNGLAGSAVCLYPMKTIQSVFASSLYLEEKTVNQDPVIKGWVTTGLPQGLEATPGRPKCSPDLDTKRYSVEVFKFAKEHPILSDSIKPTDKKPLFIKQGVRFTQMVVDKVSIVAGSTIKTVPVMFLGTDNGTVYKVFQNPTSQEVSILEQRDVMKNQTPIYQMKLYKDAVFIGGHSSVIRMPTHHCAHYTSCTTCVLTRDPYCGWSEDKCVTKGHANTSSWIQDINYGDSASVCPSEPPSCAIEVIKENPGQETILECKAEGIPVPEVVAWEKDSVKLAYDGKYRIQKTGSQGSQRLSISPFGVKHLGTYTCQVQSTMGKADCSLEVKGSLPAVTSGFTKHALKTYFSCTAKGTPLPSISMYKVSGGVSQLLPGNNVSIEQDMGLRAYYCVAQNAFGPAVGRNYTIEDRKLKVGIRITSETWSNDLGDMTSIAYSTLAAQVSSAVSTVYHKYPAFIRTTEITFRSGSVVCEMRLQFATDPLDKHQELLSDLQQAVDDGKLVSFTVDSKHRLYNYNTKGPTGGYRESAVGVDSGLFVVAVMVAILISIIIGFLLGVKFHQRALNTCGKKPEPDDIDATPSNKHKNVTHLKYTKSPPKLIHEDETEYQGTRQTLLRRGPDGAEATKAEEESSDIECDSDTSTAGRIDYRASSPSSQGNGRLPTESAI
ncbi:semaphorin-3B isoform X2 [Nematostella vectensis]|uniref:semaphorin-3B isoform X2 n=1 Tax=Nematostella vectensis TaxID=45351 RepID=UPI002076F24B|nr:semaphorin-3B isoform X2 [Nematostella vectensis]